MSSLPVPVSPKMSTGEGILATVSTWPRTCIRLRPFPIIASSSRFLRVTGRQGLVYPESFSSTRERSIRSKLGGSCLRWKEIAIFNSKNTFREYESYVCAPARRRCTDKSAKDHCEVALVRKPKTVRHIRNG